jgi:hypothetical protein
MKTMETRHPVRPTGGAVGSGGVGAIGAGVPLAAVLGAVVTSLNWERSALDEVPIPAVAWGCAVLISVGGLLTSLLLALLQARTQQKLASTVAYPPDDAKPAFDPDTFDVVGSRG